MTEYERKIWLLNHKYGDFVDEFKKHQDDRKLAVVMMERYRGICKDMEGITNVSIKVAVNRYLKEEDQTIESIVTRFTGKVYKNGKWEDK